MNDIQQQSGKDSRRILLMLTAFSAAFLIAALVSVLISGDFESLLPGLIRINTSPSQFTMDYFKLGGRGSAFLNTSLIGFACCAILYGSNASCTGLTAAAWWLNTGFGTFGMTFLTIWPFFLGVWIYSRIRKIPFGSVANTAMFSTALAPFAGELLFRYPLAEARGFCFPGLIGALILGIAVGCAMPALCAHSPAFHKGYDLYSAGPAAGMLAFLITCILFYSPGIPLPSNTDLGDGEKAFVNGFFLILFLLCLPAARLTDRDCFKKYGELWKSDGYKTDYITRYGLGTALVNMGVYGLFILLYYNAVHGFTVTDGHLVFAGAKFTGATMGAIMCMFAFSCHGAQPRTVFPVMIGYALASFLPFLAFAGGAAAQQKWMLTSQPVLVGLCFASGLAPVSGKFGFPAGVAAGAMHAVLVMSVPLLHGGFCLYNGGFTAGIVAFLLVPVLETFSGK